MVQDSHSIRHLSDFITWSKENAFSIDGYVMSGKKEYQESKLNFSILEKIPVNDTSNEPCGSTGNCLLNL